MYKNTQEIKDHNRRIGHHFFDKDIMKLWGTRLYNRVYEGQYFITYEKDEYGQGFTIRKCINGVVHPVSAFKQYSTYKQAEMDIPVRGIKEGGKDTRS